MSVTLNGVNGYVPYRPPGQWPVVNRGGGGGGRGGRGGYNNRRNGNRGGGGGATSFIENRGAHRGSFRGKTILPKLDMTPVGNFSNINIYWEESEKRLNALKKEPIIKIPQPEFVYEPYETDFPQEASGLLKELMEEREQNALKDSNGNVIGMCGHTHGEVCQFCDGRRGKWAKPGCEPGNLAFKRYQDAIIGLTPCSSSTMRLARNKYDS